MMVLNLPFTFSGCIYPCPIIPEEGIAESYD